MGDLVLVDTRQEFNKAKRLLLQYLKWLHQGVKQSYALEYDFEEAYRNDIALCDNESVQFYLIKHEGIDIGICLLKFMENKQVEIKRFYIAPMFRGLGFGKLALQNVFDLVREDGYHVIILETTSFMETAQQVYKALGFIEIGAYNGECPPQHRNVVKFMQKSLL